MLEESLLLGPGEFLVETGEELLFRRATISAVETVPSHSQT